MKAGRVSVSTSKRCCLRQVFVAVILLLAVLFAVIEKRHPKSLPAEVERSCAEPRTASSNTKLSRSTACSHASRVFFMVGIFIASLPQNEPGVDPAEVGATVFQPRLCCPGIRSLQSCRGR